MGKLWEKLGISRSTISLISKIKLDQIPIIRQTLLGDPSKRTDYDSQLITLLRAERDKKLDKLMSLVKLRAAKGGLSVSDRDLLRTRAVALGLTSDDLDRLIEPIPQRAEPPREEEGPEPITDVLDGTTRRQIRGALEHVGKRDLYDSLGLPRDAPTAELIGRAAVERQRWMQKSQVTAQKTLWLEVISYAQSHLLGVTERARYDKTLLADAEDLFMESVVFAVAGLGRLDMGTKHVLLGDATSRGITPDRAEKLIRHGCSTQGVARDGQLSVVSDSAPLRLLRCRSCGGVSDFATVARGGKKPDGCRHCGASLLWSCPVCDRQHWVDELRCSCGLPIEAVEPLIRHFDAAQSAFKRRDFSESLEHLEAARSLAPKHLGVKKGFDKIRERQTAIAKARASWETARSAKMFVTGLAAVKLWEGLAAADDPALVTAWGEVTQAIQSARSFMARAKAAEASDSSAARGFYRQALAQVADFAEAIEGLKRCPPDPPTGLIAELTGDRVTLRWMTPVDDGLGPPLYRVLRKLGTVPSSVSDGELIAETAASICEDSSARAGDSYGYAIFSRRGGIDSRRGAMTGPLLVIGEVQGFRAEARSREVQLWWTTPDRAAGVALVRKLGVSPETLADGDRIDSLRESAWDKGLADDQVYGYTVFAQYKDSGGQLVSSRGVTLVVRPHAPVIGLEAPTLQIESDGRLRLSWTPPERGVVRIVRLARTSELAYGSILTSTDVAALEGTIFSAASLEHAIDPDPPESGTCLYYSLLGWAGQWVVGHAALYSCLADPTDLRVVRMSSDGRALLRWRWNPRAAFCRVVARDGVFPTHADDPQSISVEIDEAEYSRQGYLAWLLPNAIRGPWRICVYSISHVDGERFVSAGVEPTARTTLPGPNPEVTLSYRLKRPRFPGRPWRLTFRTDPAGSDVPATVLVDHPRAVPLTTDDGQIIERFPASRDGASFSVQGSTNLSHGRARIFVDPLADPDALTPIRLKHPTTQEARA